MRLSTRECPVLSNTSKTLGVRRPYMSTSSKTSHTNSSGRPCKEGTLHTSTALSAWELWCNTNFTTGNDDSWLVMFYLLMFLARVSMHNSVKVLSCKGAVTIS